MIKKLFIILQLWHILPQMNIRSNRMEIPVMIDGGGTVLVTAADNTPMPQETELYVEDRKTERIIFIFDRGGQFTYRIAQKSDPDENRMIDDTVYCLHVTTDAFGTLVNVYMAKEDSNEKAGQIHFENHVTGKKNPPSPETSDQLQKMYPIFVMSCFITVLAILARRRYRL